MRPELLDYSKGRLTASESKKIREHLQKCAECATLLDEEIAFSNMLSSIPKQSPANDVWALVRSRIKPRRSLSNRVISIFRTRIFIRAAALIACAASFLGFYILSGRNVDNNTVKPTPVTVNQQQKQTEPETSTLLVKWSDDPVGDHTDATLKIIEEL